MAVFFQLNKLINPEFWQVMVQVLPEFSLLCLAVFVLVFDSFLPRLNMLNLNGSSNHNLNNIEVIDNLEFKNYKITFWLVIIVLLFVSYLIYWQHNLLVSDAIFYSPAVDNLVSNMIINDNLSYILKFLMAIFVLLSFYYSNNYLNTNKLFSGEYYSMGMFALIGMMVLVSSQHMLTLYLGLELFSLPVYAMIAMNRNSAVSSEAALKYFVMGAIASGILLFGISIIYGLVGSLVFSDIYNYNNISNPAYMLGLIFICVGVAFKLGVAPFHMWMPDVYQGAPTPSALFVATAPKLAAFGMAVRIFHDSFASSSTTWGVLLLILAVLSITWGNLGAIAQVNLKRLLAYSGINHMGFVLLALVVASSDNTISISQGYTAGLFYVIVYSITALAVFGFILINNAPGAELEKIDDYKGLYYTNSWHALLLMILLFSMAGVPPLVGFIAKMVVIQGLVLSGFYITAIYAVLMSVIGAYYYLRLVWVMFFILPDSNQEKFDNKLNLNKLIISLNCLMIVLLGIYGQWLYSWCASVF